VCSQQKKETLGVNAFTGSQDWLWVCGVGDSEMKYGKNEGGGTCRV